MDSQSIVAALDVEISRLEQARKLLAEGGSFDGILSGKTKGSPGRKAAKKRQMSAETRARIAEAQRRRWAKSKKLAALSAIKAAKKAAKKAETSSAAPS